jgi:hypothetical protein
VHGGEPGPPHYGEHVRQPGGNPTPINVEDPQCHAIHGWRGRGRPTNRWEASTWVRQPIRGSGRPRSYCGGNGCLDSDACRGGGQAGPVAGPPGVPRTRHGRGLLRVREPGELAVQDIAEQRFRRVLRRPGAGVAAGHGSTPRQAVTVVLDPVTKTLIETPGSPAATRAMPAWRALPAGGAAAWAAEGCRGAGRSLGAAAGRRRPDGR